MLKYFDKTFFKFALGFFAIIFASILVSMATDYHDQKAQRRAQICCADIPAAHGGKE